MCTCNFSSLTILAWRWCFVLLCSVVFRLTEYTYTQAEKRATNVSAIQIETDSDIELATKCVRLVHLPTKNYIYPPAISRLYASHVAENYYSSRPYSSPSLAKEPWYIVRSYSRSDCGRVPLFAHSCVYFDARQKVDQAWQTKPEAVWQKNL